MPLPLATISFALCFAAWGLISAFATVFRQAYHLNATSTAFLIATPVLLGALARLPVGMLADRFGGRLIFPLVMLVSAGAAFAVPLTGSFTALLATAFWLGVAGSSFAVGVGFVSRWTPQERQGAALGVYGLGNLGQSAAVFGGPVLAIGAGQRLRVRPRARPHEGVHDDAGGAPDPRRGRGRLHVEGSR